MQDVVETFISIFRLCEVVVEKSVAIYIFVVLKVFVRWLIKKGRLQVLILFQR